MGVGCGRRGGEGGKDGEVRDVCLDGRERGRGRGSEVTAASIEEPASNPSALRCGGVGEGEGFSGLACVEADGDGDGRRLPSVTGITHRLTRADLRAGHVGSRTASEMGRERETRWGRRGDGEGEEAAAWDRMGCRSTRPNFLSRVLVLPPGRRRVTRPIGRR